MRKNFIKMFCCHSCNKIFVDLVKPQLFYSFNKSFVELTKIFLGPIFKIANFKRLKLFSLTSLKFKLYIYLKFLVEDCLRSLWEVGSENFFFNFGIFHLTITKIFQIVKKYI